MDKSTKRRHRERGFALIMVIGIVLLFLVIGGTTALMVSRAQRMSAGQMRYSAAVEAADGAQDLAMFWINTIAPISSTPSHFEQQALGRYTVDMNTELQGIYHIAGQELSFAMSYEGTSGGQGNKGTGRYYRVVTTAYRTNSIDPITLVNRSERARIETVRRKVVGE